MMGASQPSRTRSACEADAGVVLGQGFLAVDGEGNLS
jgi:hypothetical protein